MSKKKRMGSPEEFGQVQKPPMAQSTARRYAKRIPGAEHIGSSNRGVWRFPMDFRVPAEWRKKGRK